MGPSASLNPSTHLADTSSITGHPPYQARAIDCVLPRLPDVRKTGKGWRAPCPAHRGRKRSLAINEGCEGVFLRCWSRGCTLSEIAAAVGLRVSDLFNKPQRQQAVAQQQPLTADAVEAALRAHLQRILDQEAAQLGYQPPITSRHHNAARRVVSRLLDIPLRLKSPAWWEHAQYDSDPLWEMLAQHALLEIVTQRGHAEPTREDYLDAEERAAAWMRGEARRGMQHARVT
jgi:hypothetical protein